MSSAHRTRNPQWKTRALLRTATACVVPSYRVEVLSGRDRGAVAASIGSHLGIGTAPGNQLILTDAAVSRHHCAIEATEEGFLFRDLQSTNGSGLGGHRVLNAYLAPGDILTVGESSLRFDVGTAQTEETLSSRESFGELLGSSVAMRRIFSVLEKLVDVPVTVLITGETGTGKGAVAAALHAEGARAKGPLVVVDCAAIPDALVESELFGHEKGAFTGADRQHIGAFERAKGGTVFLDEVGELPIDMQPKLLRVLESKEIRRVGGSAMIPIDIRIVAATNRDLRAEINSGAFRSDLYYRLNVMSLTLPPLRERREDIPLLVERFYRHFASDAQAAPPADLLSRLMRHHLPGNVRELRAAVEREVVLGDLAGQVSLAPPRESSDLDFTVSYRDAKEHALKAWESRYLPELLARYDGNLSRAARAVRMDRNHLRKLLSNATEPEE